MDVQDNSKAQESEKEKERVNRERWIVEWLQETSPELEGKESEWGDEPSGEARKPRL